MLVQPCTAPPLHATLCITLHWFPTATSFLLTVSAPRVALGLQSQDVSEVTPLDNCIDYPPIHWRQMAKTPPSPPLLKLNQIKSDEIFSHFRARFPKSDFRNLPAFTGFFFSNLLRKNFHQFLWEKKKKKTKFTKYNFGETILSWGRLSRLETASASFVHNKLQWLA